MIFEYKKVYGWNNKKFFFIKCFEVEAMELSKAIKTKYMTWFYDGI